MKGKLKSGSSFEWIQRKITPKEVEEIKALRLPGISFLKENKRFYPNAQLAAHVIGFVGLDSKGLEGVESQYDTLLNGNKQVWNTAKRCPGPGDRWITFLPRREITSGISFSPWTNTSSISLRPS